MDANRYVTLRRYRGDFKTKVIFFVGWHTVLNHGWSVTVLPYDVAAGLEGCTTFCIVQVGKIKLAQRMIFMDT